MKTIDTLNFVSRYPGSGKDTVQASLVQLLQDHAQKVQQFGAGNAVRWHKNNKTELGIEAAKYSPTQLLPFDLMRRMIDEYLKNLDSEGVLLINGWPRSAEQIPSYDDAMQRLQRSDVAVFLDVSRAEADRRMKNRNERPEDRDPAARAERLDEAEQTIGPVISYFEDNKKIVRIDGMQSPESVIEETISNLRRLGIDVPDYAQS